MRKKRNSTIKVRPPKEVNINISSGISTTRSETFYQKFPFQLTHKDGTEVKICWFSEEYHMEKYIDRYKLQKDSYKVVNKHPNLDSSGKAPRSPRKADES
jgi:hypothetical protein